jgi:hypothetical protein
LANSPRQAAFPAALFDEEDGLPPEPVPLSVPESEVPESDELESDVLESDVLELDVLESDVLEFDCVAYVVVVVVEPAGDPDPVVVVVVVVEFGWYVVPDVLVVVGASPYCSRIELNFAVMSCSVCLYFDAFAPATEIIVLTSWVTSLKVLMRSCLVCSYAVAKLCASGKLPYVLAPSPRLITLLLASRS